jgi:hypothetical protein
MRRGRIGAHIAKLPELLGEAKSAELPNPDMDERTNSLGLFNFAEAYRLSAIALQLENIAHGHAHTCPHALSPCN